MNRNPDRNHDMPLVRIGQGEYARDIWPEDIDNSRGLVVGCVVVLGAMVLAFVAGLLIGGVLW